MNIADELERLRALRDNGALSEEEFVRAKARVLGDGPGAGAYSGEPQTILHQLRRSRTDCVLGGVCGGLGRYTGMPSWSWRVLFCLAVIGFGFGILLYLLLWLFIPQES